MVIYPKQSEIHTMGPAAQLGTIVALRMIIVCVLIASTFAQL